MRTTGATCAPVAVSISGGTRNTVRVRIRLVHRDGKMRDMTLDIDAALATGLIAAGFAVPAAQAEFSLARDYAVATPRRASWIGRGN